MLILASADEKPIPIFQDVTRGEVVVDLARLDELERAIDEPGQLFKSLR